MASLLDYLNKAGSGLLALGQGLAAPEIAPDASLEELAGQPGADAARAAARKASMAAFMKPGQRWYQLTTAGDLAGQQAYDSSIATAAKTAEALRMERERTGRTAAIAKMIETYTKAPEDGSKPQMSQLQADALRALPEDEQARALLSLAYPKLSSSGVATAGQIEKVFRGKNGNAHIITQTGDPTKPWAIEDTGVPYPQDIPAEAMNAMIFGGNPALYQHPFLRGRESAEGTKTGEANIDALTTLPDLRVQAQNSLQSLTAIREQVKSMPTGPIAGEVAAKLDSQFQSARAALVQQALVKIGQLKSMGVNLTPITEKELGILMSTSAQLSNYSEANVQILDREIASIQRIIQELDAKLSVLYGGGDVTQYRPVTAPPPAAAPAAAPPANRPPLGSFQKGP